MGPIKKIMALSRSISEAKARTLKKCLLFVDLKTPKLPFEIN
jgi:hypothetical protein